MIMGMNLFDYATIIVLFIITLMATLWLAEAVHNYWEGL